MQSRVNSKPTALRIEFESDNKWLKKLNSELENVELNLKAANENDTPGYNYEMAIEAMRSNHRVALEFERIRTKITARINVAAKQCTDLQSKALAHIFKKMNPMQRMMAYCSSGRVPLLENIVSSRITVDDMIRDVDYPIQTLLAFKSYNKNMPYMGVVAGPAVWPLRPKTLFCPLVKNSRL